jgi:hypothetical protein
MSEWPRARTRSAGRAALIQTLCSARRDHSLVFFASHRVASEAKPKTCVDAVTVGLNAPQPPLKVNQDP